MGLLQKLKSALGLDGATSSDAGRSGDVDVTVEREPSTEDEDAVKGTDTSTTSAASTDDTDAAADTSTSADDVTASTADDGEPSVTGDTDEAEAVDEDETPDETTEEDDAEAVEEADAGAADEDEAGAVDEDDATDEAVDEDDAGSTDSVTELNGIGPAYAERLAGQGIETVGELAVADPEAIAAETDLGPNRVADWVEQAREY